MSVRVMSEENFTTASHQTSGSRCSSTSEQEKPRSQKCWSTRKYCKSPKCKCNKMISHMKQPTPPWEERTIQHTHQKTSLKSRKYSRVKANNWMTSDKCNSRNAQQGPPATTIKNGTHDPDRGVPPTTGPDRTGSARHNGTQIRRHHVGTHCRNSDPQDPSLSVMTTVLRQDTRSDQDPPTRDQDASSATCQDTTHGTAKHRRRTAKGSPTSKETDQRHPDHGM